MAGLGGAVADRIQAEAGHGPHFRIERQHLAQQRVVRIAVAHARDAAARHPQRELRGGGIRDAQRDLAQAEQGEQFAGLPDGLAPGLLPAARLHREGGCGYHVRLNP